MKFTTIANAKRQIGLSYLGRVGISGKLQKSEKKNRTLTYCIYFAPANKSGYNVCRASTPECRRGCLATSGRTLMDIRRGKNIIESARIKKTRLFFEQQEFFMNWLVAEINGVKNKAKNKNMDLCIRLNGTSDIDWTKPTLNCKNIFEIFPDINFYDYTKDKNRFNALPKNYHLTLSFTGRNWFQCKSILKKGYNVAMVFNIPSHKPLPETFEGYTVIDGDITDLRIKDKKGVIVGLRWKNIADKQANDEVKKSCFAIQPNNPKCKY